ncbi:hypothetical protein ACOME3_004071 [Neoechinorhynchus agilis]
MAENLKELIGSNISAQSCTRLSRFLLIFKICELVSQATLIRNIEINKILLIFRHLKRTGNNHFKIQQYTIHNGFFQFCSSTVCHAYANVQLFHMRSTNV